MADGIVRIVGVDFGTSTSTIAYLNYDERSGALALPSAAAHPELIRDASGRAGIPTALLAQPGHPIAFGTEAVIRGQSETSLLREGFKMNLVEGPDEDIRADAASQTQLFLEHLWQRYRDGAELPRSGSFREETRISYPAKWPDPVRQEMVAMFERAGFPNVVGISEPEAAMRYFAAIRPPGFVDMVDEGVVPSGKDMTVLLLDMGAGTTDLVLYRATPEGDRAETLLSWPPIEDASRSDVARNVSGREIDKLLWRRLFAPHFPEPHVTLQQYRKVVTDIADWKTQKLSPALTHDRALSDIPVEVLMLTLSQPDVRLPKYETDRSLIVEQFRDYLEAFVALIDAALKEATGPDKLPGGGEDVDLVLLTGGHSNWWWAKDAIVGTLPGVPGPDLPKIVQEPRRVLRGPHPQETVARGLALSGQRRDIVPVAANTAYLKIVFQKHKPVASIEVDLQGVGDRLPKEATELILNARFAFPDPKKQLACRASLMVGVGERKKFRNFSDVDCAVPYVGWFTGLIARYAKAVGEEERANIYVETSVSVDESYEVVGLIDLGWKEAQYGFFSFPSRTLSAADENRLSGAYGRARTERATST